MSAILSDTSISDLGSDIEEVEAVPSRSPSPQLVSTRTQSKCQSPEKGRPRRARKEPAKMRDNAESTTTTALLDLSRKAVVRCSQTNKLHLAKISELSREDNLALTEEDLQKGSRLMFLFRKKEYPVQFLKFKDEDKTGKEKKQDRKRSRKEAEDEGQDGLLRDEDKENAQRDKGKRPCKEIEKQDDVGVPVIRNKTETASILAKAHKKTKGDPDANGPAHVVDVEGTTDKKLLKELVKKVNEVQTTLKELVEIIKARQPDQVEEFETKPQVGDEFINGRNMMRVPARDAYAFALHLMDSLFTKEEMSKSLLFKSEKSPKPGLSPTKVKRIIRLVERRYGTDWDERKLIAKANQKCRDSKPIVIKDECD